MEHSSTLPSKAAKAEFAIIVLAIAALSISLNQNPTGFLFMKNRHVPMNITATESQSYILNFDLPTPILSFAASGRIIGDGTVSIWLKSDSGKYLVYTNADKAPGSYGLFINECTETCALPLIEGPYELSVSISGDTTLILDEISYALAE